MNSTRVQMASEQEEAPEASGDTRLPQQGLPFSWRLEQPEAGEEGFAAAAAAFGGSTEPRSGATAEAPETAPASAAGGGTPQPAQDAQPAEEAASPKRHADSKADHGIEWVMCDTCKKWRKASAGTAAEGYWDCSDNPDERCATSRG